MSREVPDLVEKKGSCVGQLDPSYPSPRGSGESPFLMAEEFARDQALRERTTLNGDEGTFQPAALTMDRSCHEVLSHARFTEDENGGVGLRNLGYLGSNPLDSLACTNDAIVA